MLRINLLDPKAEPTLTPGKFILPLQEETNWKTAFMILRLIESRISSPYYNLKKVIKFSEFN